MKRQYLHLSLPICIAVVVAGAWLADAGPLNPPPGPIDSTGRFGPRTEIDSLPYTITQSGSYYLGQTLWGTAPNDGIVIAADDVDIDLNGFALIGAAGTNSGITDNFSGESAITIHDGKIRGWGNDGIVIAAGGRHHVYSVTIEDNGSGGVVVGPGSILRNVISTGNEIGIDAVDGCKLTNCIATDNQYDGIVTTASHVSDSVAAYNGMNGIVLGRDCVLIGSVAVGNAENGVLVEQNCRVTDCTASGNGYGLIAGSGFLVMLENNHFHGCVANENWEHGFVGDAAMTGNAAEACTASWNGQSAWGDGFRYFQNVIGCLARCNQGVGVLSGEGVCINTTASENANYGIYVWAGTVADCGATFNGAGGIWAQDTVVRNTTASFNVDDGIEVDSGCHVWRNNCVGNQDDGIEVVGIGNTIEDNSCYNNVGDAIDTTAGGPNTVLSNRETGNGGGYNLNWAADTWGQIFAAGPGPVNTGGAGDHFVNISY
jgi:hypothetical protein